MWTITEPIDIWLLITYCMTVLGSFLLGYVRAKKKYTQLQKSERVSE